MAREMNRANHQLSLVMSLDSLVAESVAFLRQHEPPEGYFVGFSGGKDSICAEHLCKLAGVKYQAFYSCTKIDPPEVVRFIRDNYPGVAWLYPKMTMWQGIRKKAPPLRMQRWCCDVLKKEPGKDHPLKHRVMGIRAEESTKRASRPRIDTFYGQTTYKPIFRWPEWAVWELIEAEGLKYLCLYDEGFHRIGCVICPAILGMAPGATRQRQISKQRWLGFWKAYEQAVKSWWIRKNAEGKWIPPFPGQTADDFWQSYLLGFEDRPKI